MPQEDSIYYVVPDSTPLITLSDIPVCYEMGYFQDNSLLHPEIPLRKTGFSGATVSYKLWQDDCISLLVLLCSVFFILLAHGIYRRIGKITKTFLYPSSNLSAAEEEESHISSSTSFFICGILCLMGSIGTYIYWHTGEQFFIRRTSPYIIISVYMAAWAMYFMFKNLIYSFVNWVFFDMGSREIWRKAYSYILALETLFFLPIILLSIYTNVLPEISVYAVAAIVILTRILLLYKTYHIFFGKIYGILHLFVYLCTLEAMPLLVLLKILSVTADDLIVKL